MELGSSNLWRTGSGRHVCALYPAAITTEHFVFSELVKEAEYTKEHLIRLQKIVGK